MLANLSPCWAKGCSWHQTSRSYCGLRYLIGILQEDVQRILLADVEVPTLLLVSRLRSSISLLVVRCFNLQTSDLRSPELSSSLDLRAACGRPRFGVNVTGHIKTLDSTEIHCPPSGKYPEAAEVSTLKSRQSASKELSAFSHCHEGPATLHRSEHQLQASEILQ